MCKVSVIIPCYNAKEYIGKCIEKLEKQTFENFEVVIIDDCSTDGTFLFLEKMKLESSLNISLLQLAENSGPGIARKEGIKLAKGDYIAFCDSDDYYEEEYLEKMYQKALVDNADIVMCNSKLLLADGSYRNNNYTEIFDKYNSKADYIALSKTSFCYLLVKKTLFDHIKIPSLRNGEDMATIPLLIQAANCISHIKDALYVYCIRDGSASMAPSINSFYDLLKCQSIINEAWNDNYKEALEFIGIKNLLYSAILVGLKVGVSYKEISILITRFNMDNRRWYKNKYLKTLAFRYRFFLKTIQYRMIILSYIYVRLHTILMK